MKTLRQFKKELITERPQLQEKIACDLAELRLSEQLRKVRKDAGLTQQAVAERVLSRHFIDQPFNWSAPSFRQYPFALGLRRRAGLSVVRTSLIALKFPQLYLFL